MNDWIDEWVTGMEHYATYVNIHVEQDQDNIIECHWSQDSNWRYEEENATENNVFEGSLSRKLYMDIFARSLRKVNHQGP